MNEERRNLARHSFRCVVEARTSTRGDEERQVIPGQAVDLSAEGAGIVGALPDDRNAILVWQFHLPGVPAPLPVLAQIRWVEPVSSSENTYRFGLLFLP